MDKWGYSYLIEVENIVGKGEIARYEQFLFFPQCFQKLSVVHNYLWSKMLTIISTGQGFIDKNKLKSIREWMMISNCTYVQVDLIIHSLKNKTTVTDGRICDGLILSQTTSFTPFQTKRVSRRQFQI